MSASTLAARAAAFASARSRVAQAATRRWPGEDECGTRSAEQLLLRLLSRRPASESAHLVLLFPEPFRRCDILARDLGRAAFSQGHSTLLLRLLEGESEGGTAWLGTMREGDWPWSAPTPVLDAAALASNASELLRCPQQRLAEELRALSRRYELVLIYPGCRSSTPLLSRVVKAGAAVCLVAEANRTEVPALNSLAAELAEAGAQLLGTVLCHNRAQSRDRAVRKEAAIA